MNAATQEKIDFYVGLYDSISSKTGNDTISAVLFQEIIKDMRMKYLARSNGNGNGSGNGLATEKQKEYLRKIGCTFDDSLSKKDASAMIDAQLKR
jgi:hypothetical protein